MNDLKKHQVVHTANLLADMMAGHLVENRTVQANPKWKRLIDDAFEALWKVCQETSKDTITETALKRIIISKSHRRGNFTLASGVQTNYFFDLKPTMLDPEGSNLIADAILDKIAMLNSIPGKIPITAVGGMATGGIPLVSVVSAKSYLYGMPLPAFFVRQETKDHGTERRIEGTPLNARQRVMLIEDVTTTGGSILQAMKVVREIGAFANDVITVVDRLEGAEQNLKEHYVWLHALFVRTDFEDEDDTIAAEPVSKFIEEQIAKGRPRSS